MPIGTPDRIAMPTATPTIDTCSTVRSPMIGRMCRMNASVSTALSPLFGRPSERRARRIRQPSAGAPPSAAQTCDSSRSELAERVDAMNAPTATASLLQRLEHGPVICAEGYVFELERRGYLQAGAFVPEVVLEHPEVVRQLPRDFVHAGSDVVEALTYYAHREKLRVIGREGALEPINRAALDIAKSVAAESGALFAGDICNTN